MAAPQWGGGKCKSIQQAKAFFQHNDKDRRLEQRHSNVHIDKSKTHLNFSYRGLDYGQLCQAYDRRMSEIDQGRQTTGKNARTVLQSVVVYPPAGITDQDTLRRWFMRAGDVLNERFGDNFLDMQVDFDENHEYYDPEKGGMVISREHGHARLVPEVDGKLNGKQFSSRAAITGLNDALQEMSLREFGVPMMDGSKRKGRKTVEQLKAKSEAAAIIVQARAEADAIRADAGYQAETIRRRARQDAEAAQKAAEARCKAQEAQAREKAIQIAREAQAAAQTLQNGLAGVEYFRDLEAFAGTCKNKNGVSMLDRFHEQRRQQGKPDIDAAAAAAAAREAERMRQQTEQAMEIVGRVEVQRQLQQRQQRQGKQLGG